MAKGGYKTNSPTALGYPASKETVGTRRKGKDGYYYKVIKTSAGLKRWAPVSKALKEKHIRRRSAGKKRYCPPKKHRKYTLADVKRILGASNVDSKRFNDDPLYQGRLQYRACEKERREKKGSRPWSVGGKPVRGRSRSPGRPKKKRGPGRPKKKRGPGRPRTVSRSPGRPKKKGKKRPGRPRSVSRGSSRRRRSSQRTFKTFAFGVGGIDRYKQLQRYAKRGVKELQKFLNSLSRVERKRHIMLANAVFRRIYSTVFYIMKTKNLIKRLPLTSKNELGFVLHVMHLKPERIKAFVKFPGKELRKHIILYKKGSRPITKARSAFKSIVDLNLKRRGSVVRRGKGKKRKV